MLWRMNGRPSANKAVPFSDVDIRLSEYRAIQWAAESGIIKGYKDGTFRPEDTMSREQVATILWRMSGKPAATADVKFKDVDQNMSGYMAIQWGQEAGVIKGYKDNTFRPTEECLREHSVTFLYRYARNILGK